MKINKKILLVLITSITLTFTLAGCSLKNSTMSNSTQPQAEQSVQNKVISLVGENGKSVFDILKASHQVDSTDSSFGVMINSIDSVASTDKEFWLYSVNGKSGEIAADKYITKDGDQILWEFKAM